MNSSSQQLIAPGTGAFVTLKAKQILRISGPEGGQTGDLMAFREADATECLSNGRTFEYAETIYLSAGHVLYSNKSNAMLTILRDDVGTSDFLYAPCSAESYRIQHGAEDHVNCLDNLAAVLAALGVAKHHIPTAFNFFMNAKVGVDGRLSVAPSLARPDDALEFRAEMDLAIGLTACPALSCNGGRIKPLHYVVLD